MSPTPHQIGIALAGPSFSVQLFAAFEIPYLSLSNFASMPFNFLLYFCMYMPVAVRMHIMGE